MTRLLAPQLITIACVFGVFFAFAFKQTFLTPQRSARIQKQGGSPFLGRLPMEFAYWVLNPLGDFATWLKLSPNWFSWSCLFLGFVSGAFASIGWVSAAGGVGIISSLFDSLDGMVARRRGVASDAGEVLDAAIDRYTEIFFLGGLTIYYRFSPLAMTLTLFALMGSLLVSYSQAKAEAMKLDHLIPKGWMRRPERAAYLNGGAFVSPVLTALGLWLGSREFSESALHWHLPVLLVVVLVGTFSNLTAVQRYIVMYRALKPKSSPKN